MPKSRTVIRWQRKQPSEANSYPSVKLDMRKPTGISDVASWLDTSKPEEVLSDLRNYQDEWCPAHVDEVIAQRREGGVLVQHIRCRECSRITIKRRRTTSDA